VTSLSQLPDDLPVPKDDGACDHLPNTQLSNIELIATDGSEIDLSSLDLVVIYIYPMTGRPDVSLPDGWDQIPGARGCTPQSCSFRDHYQELQKLGATVFGLSTQSTEYQLEAKTRLHLPFELVSDENLKFINTLSLPTIEVAGMKLSKRVTLIARGGIIEKVFYPVFPPDENADQVIEYLNEHKA